LEGLAHRVIGTDREIKILQTMEIQYACDCSKERFRGPLLSLGTDELNGLYQEEEKIEVKCQFCNKFYHYRKEELNTGEGQDA
jgi:molecular chaperone Hsp33